jgi:hypothetical protein
MKKNVLAIVLSICFIIISCVTTQQFKIVSLGDKFSDPSKPQGFAGVKNRLSTKSSTGEIIADDKGVYLDPFVHKDRNTNDIIKIGFFITHITMEQDRGFRPIKEIIFLTDNNDRVLIIPESHDSDYDIGTWKSISSSYLGPYTEKYICLIPKSDFYKISHSSYLEVKIIGGKLTQTYDKKNVLSSFTKNLKTFYDAQIKSKATNLKLK